MKIKSFTVWAAMAAAIVGAPAVGLAQTAPAATPAPAPAPAAPAAPEPNAPFGGMITGVVTLTSDYRFRGISQSKNDPALQGGLTYEVPLAFTGLPISIYGGFWGSSVNFSPDVDESVEIDMVAGVKFKAFDEKLLIDLGWIGYRYPGALKAARLPFDEFGGQLTYDFGFAQLSGQVRYSPNFFANSGDAWYKGAMLTVPLSFITIHEKVSFKAFAGIGHQSIQRNARFFNPDYTEWQIGLVATVYGIDLGLTYVDTNISKSRCNGGGFNYCSGRAVFSLGKAF
ncbi:MAG: hypothetical protein IPK81_09445 [Rhodospirillales bacterium]|nr:MAG: hypothetical protein IPK81_09445 [Rhodospirillales bacterium]